MNLKRKIFNYRHFEFEIYIQNIVFNIKNFKGIKNLNLDWKNQRFDFEDKNSIYLIKFNLIFNFYKKNL